MGCKNNKWIGFIFFLSLNIMSFQANAQSCADQFDDLHSKLMRSMNAARSKTGIELIHLSHIAFNRFAQGPSTRGNEVPQTYKEMESLMGTRAAQRALVDLIVHRFKRANQRNSKVAKQIASLIPETAMSYQQLSDDFRTLFSVVRKARKNGDAAAEVAALKEVNRFRQKLRDAAPENAIAWGLTDSMNINSVLTEFWWNHFNVDAQKSYLHVLDYEKQLSRRVCGTFLSMLKASATHPAMLQYLDNVSSVKAGLKRKGFGTGINENYGRELLELYTLGVGPRSPAEASPYNQSDVTRAAKLLTGWSYKRVEGEKPKFVFNDFAHDKSRNPIMGQTFPEGVRGGLKLLEYLASHNRTKSNICRKLVTELAGDNAGNSVISACKAAWGQYGNLASMYTAIITHPSYWRWGNYRQSLKNPIELVISAKRAMGYGIYDIKSRKELKDLAKKSENLGIYPRHFPPPTGYPVSDKVWANPNYLTQAINMAHALADDRLPLVIDNQKYRGNKAEDKIAEIADRKPSTAVTHVLRDQLKTYPNYFAEAAGRDQLVKSIQNPDKEKATNLLVPGRTVNSLILGSRLFISK